MAASKYSTVGDLLIGDMPVSMGFSKQKFVDDAANEVDSIIGQRYKTPLDFTDPSPMPRHTVLFVQRVSNHLATGRLILALAIGGEDQALHAYGYSLVQQALAALQQIADGTYDLVGATPIPTEETTRVTGPKITNVDETSGVETFYAALRTQNPLVPADSWYPGAS